LGNHLLHNEDECVTLRVLQKPLRGHGSLNRAGGDEESLWGKKRYHQLWYVGLKDKSTLPCLYFLKTTNPERIVEQVGTISRSEWSRNDIAVQWEAFVGNEHTLPFTENPIKKLFAIHEVLQPITELLFPQWIMDRFKEALDQYVRGQWLSSISLCGDIVEFIVNEFWFANLERIPSEKRKTPSESTTRNLKTLADCEIIDENDYCRLLCVRETRDAHVHYCPRDRLLSDYPERLKSDNFEVLKKLSGFFAIDNVESKYGRYLAFASTAYFPQATDQ
jgi:hypothetical protein